MVILVSGLWSVPMFSQTDKEPEALGLPGDNLDLYAVLDIFQKSKTIEDFEKTLNDEKTKVNNLDLDNDQKVDFIKVVTKKDGDDFTFVLQDAVSKTETQDVAVILVSKDKNKKVTMQIVGDEDLYGKNYIVEPKASQSVTSNPGYVGPDPVTVNVPATTTVVVESAPIVQYVYSPAYVPYYPPYYYGYYPPYFAAFTIMAVGIYRHNHYHYHGGGYGYGNTTVIHNTNNFNNYNNNSRNRSNTVSHNKASGNYKNVGNRSGSDRGNRASTGASTRPSTGASTRPSTRPTTPSASTRQSSSRESKSTRQSASTRPSSSSSRSSSSYSGGGRSGGSGGFSGGRGGFGGGGGMRGGRR
ncbi:hypothetical protein [Flavobacterium maritimum]|uniref:hypothetical protein n=1 Tax=Flavobacterium maritimum TaxID=3149042 RepID=UPI0032B5B340